MKKLAKSLSLALTALTLAGAPALAQGFKVDTKKLDQAKFYNAPREIQITDERPVVRDFRTGDPGPSTMEINLPPVVNGQGTHTVYGSPSGNAGQGMAPYRTTNQNMPNNMLAPASAMHQSNIGARPPLGAALPDGKNIGVHTKQAVSGTMSPPRRNVATNNAAQSRPVATTTVPKSYASYASPGNGSASNSNVVQTNVAGKVTSPLITRLKSKN
jgi:hypothetical protein